MTPLLKLNDVSSGYNGNEIVRGISLNLQKGTLVSIIGPNGHGKTTLLRTISGLVRASQGQIEFDGENLCDHRVDQIVDMGIVHIPQGDLIFSEMTIEENLLMGAYLPSAHANRSAQLEYVHALLPKLLERRNQVASTLSGGERRMLAIGRALMSQNKLLLIDEPSLGLAPIIIEQIYDLIRTLKNDGHTILLVEENVSRVIDCSEMIYLLDDGKFIWSGSGEDVARDDTILQTYLGG